MQSILDKLQGWTKAHASLWAALGLVLVAVNDYGQGNYSGATKSALAAAGLLHLWGQSMPPASAIPSAPAQ